MKMIPTGHRVLVKVEQSELKKKAQTSGIYVPDDALGREQLAQQEAVVVELGPDAYKDFHSNWCKPGDHILIARYSGESRDDIEDGYSYRVINDEDVLCRLEY